jgi:uncharacterized protein (TIGR02145 family)
MKQFLSLLTLALLLCLGTFASAQIPSYVPTNGLVGWWPFNGNANDESGNGNHGTVNGAILAADRFGNAGKAYSFDGNGDYLNIAYSSTISPIIGTVSGWLKTYSSIPHQSLIFGQSHGRPQLFVNNGKVYIGWGATQGFANCASITSVDIGQWVHVLGIFSTNSFSIYVNGVLESSNSTNLIQNSCNAPLQIGGFLVSTSCGTNGSNGQFFNGFLDDIAIYNRALSPTEVQQLYLGNSPNTLAASNVPGKIHYQGLAVGANGKPIKNGTVGLRLSVLDSLPNGSALYTETKTASTDAAGIFSTYLGVGTATAGTFANIPWANGNNKFLKVEMDAQGGSNYQNMGSTQLVSVPYALHAGSADEANISNVMRGTNGQLYQLTVGANGPTWSCYPPVTHANAGSDQLNVTGTVAVLSGNSPSSKETGTWTILSGNGGSLNSNSNSNPTSTFTKGTDSAYTLVWTITGPCGTSSDTLFLVFDNKIMNTPCVGIPSISYLGENYPTVQIGTQCWLAKNLNAGTMVLGVNNQINNGILEKYCYNNDPANCATYGGLYQWAEAVQYQNGAGLTNSPSPSFTGKVKGVCPTGWHIPNNNEWSIFESYLGGASVAGRKIKSVTPLWPAPNYADNSSGFSALPTGYRYYQQTFLGLNGSTHFWSSNEASSNRGNYKDLFSDSIFYPMVNNLKTFGLVVRCIKDTLCLPTSSSAGPDQPSLTGTTATLAANTPAAGETGAWSILVGSGGSLNSNNNPTATFTKGTDSAYTLVWTISGPCGTTRDTMNLRFPAPVGTTCGQTVTYAGESYPTVQIGTQCWMAKNLNVGTMISSSINQANNNILEKYCFNNDTSYCSIYGGFYQWAEAIQYKNNATNNTITSPSLIGNIQGICPNGWHIPNDNEYCSLTTFIDPTVNCNIWGHSGTDVGTKMKSTMYWNYTPGSNSSGFSALGTGYPNRELNNETYIWTSTEFSNLNAIYRHLTAYQPATTIFRGEGPKNNPIVVRCLKD